MHVPKGPQVHVLVVSCKYTSPNQYECSSPYESNERREQLLYMCHEQLLHNRERALLDGHEEDAKHESRTRRWHVLHFMLSMPEMVICLAH